MDIQSNKSNTARTFEWFKGIGQKAGTVLTGGRRRVRRHTIPDVRLDSDIRPSELYNLQLASIDFYNRNSLATALIDVLTVNVVGPGLKPFISLDNVDGIENPNEKENEITKKFNRWASTRKSDYHHQTSWYDQQRQAYLSRLLVGGIFSLQRIEDREFSIQLVEYFRARGQFDLWGFLKPSSATADGVVYDNRGREVRYNFDAGTHPVNVRAADGRRQALHYYKQNRPGQLRGYPVLTPVIHDLKDLDQYKDYEIKAAVVAASFTVFVKSARQDPIGSGKGVLAAKYGTNSEPDDFDDEIDYALAPGAIHQLLPGEEIDVADAKRPNQNFKAFYDTVVRDLSSAVGVPMEILLKHFNTSFTAARAANLEFWKTVTMEREHFASLYCQEIFEQWLDQEVRTGRIELQGYQENREDILSSVSWVGPAQGQINEAVAATAAEKRIQAGLSTRERETIEMGTGDFYQNAEKLNQESQALPNENE